MRPAGLLQRASARLRPGVISTSFGARPLVAWPTMRAIGVERRARAARVGAHHDERRRAVVHAGRVAGRDGAVLLERRLERAPAPRRVVSSRIASSRSTTSGSPFFCGMLMGRISSVNQPSRVACAALRWLGGGVLVLLGARDVVLLGDVLAGEPHVDCSRTSHHRPSCDHRVDDRRRRPCAGPRGRACSRYGQLLIDSMPPATATSMSPHAIAWCGEHHGLQAGAAHLVDRERARRRCSGRRAAPPGAPAPGRARR